MGTIEQRRDTRVEIDVAAEVYTVEGMMNANTRNLSKTGVCLDLPSPLEEGGTIGVSLFPTADGIEDPDAEPLNVKASVIWCSERDDAGFSAGCRFEDMEDKHTSALAEILNAVE